MLKLLKRMRDDEVKVIVESDQLIRREPGLRVAALGSKSDQKQDDVYRISQATRTLGRIVIYWYRVNCFTNVISIFLFLKYVARLSSKRTPSIRYKQCSSQQFIIFAVHCIHFLPLF